MQIHHQSGQDIFAIERSISKMELQIGMLSRIREMSLKDIGDPSDRMIQHSIGINANDIESLDKAKQAAVKEREDYYYGQGPKDDGEYDIADEF